MPQLIGLENFKGPVIHSTRYRTSEPFKNKNVLLVGIGAAATDVASDLANVAGNIYLSRRRGTWITPRFVKNGRPYDEVLSRWSMMKAALIPSWLVTRYFDHKARQVCDPKLFGLHADFASTSHEPLICDFFLHLIATKKLLLKGDIEHFTSSGVIMKSGQKLDIDAVVCCTNCDIKLPYIQNVSLMQSIVDPTNNQVNLFKHIYPRHIRRLGSLALIGFVQPLGPAWPYSNYKAD